MTQQHLTREDIVALLRPQRESCAAHKTAAVERIAERQALFLRPHVDLDAIEAHLRHTWAVQDLFPCGSTVDFNGVECVVVEHERAFGGPLCPVVLLPRTTERGDVVAFERKTLMPRVAEAVAHLVRGRARP